MRPVYVTLHVVDNTYTSAKLFTVMGLFKTKKSAEFSVKAGFFTSIGPDTFALINSLSDDELLFMSDNPSRDGLIDRFDEFNTIRQSNSNYPRFFKRMIADASEVSFAWSPYYFYNMEPLNRSVYIANLKFRKNLNRGATYYVVISVHDSAEGEANEPVLDFHVIDIYNTADAAKSYVKSEIFRYLRESAAYEGPEFENLVHHNPSLEMINRFVNNREVLNIRRQRDRVLSDSTTLVIDMGGFDFLLVSEQVATN